VKKPSASEMVVSLPSSTLGARTTTDAPRATQTGLASEMGEAVATFPPTLAALRIWRPAK